MKTPGWWLRLAAYLLVVAMFAIAISRIEQVRLHDKAQQCVAAWERTEQIRNMGSAVIRLNAKTLTGLGEGPPQLIAIYRAQAAKDAIEIRATIHDPTCDVAAAKRRLR